MASFSGNFTQGGQTQLHKIRMFSQVLSVTAKIGLGVFFIVILSVFATFFTKTELWIWLCWQKAYCRLTYFNMFPKGFWDTSNIQGRELYDLWLLQDQQAFLYVKKVSAKLQHYSLISLAISAVIFTAVVFFWIRKGKQRQEKKLLSGVRIVSPKELAKTIIKQKLQSNIKIADVPLVKGAENEHTLVVGTTGVGKSNSMNQLLQQIRFDGKAVIVDTTGDFVTRFFDPERDVLLSPLDPRTKVWNLWQECNEEHLLEDFATCIIPEATRVNDDNFWDNASRTVLTVALKRTKTLEKLLHYTVQADLKQVEEFFKGTSASAMTCVDADKTALSIRMNLTTKLACLESLEDGDFAIRNWIQDDSKKGFLFLACTPSQRAKLKPLITAWFSLAGKSLLGHRAAEKVWFFVDELPSLNRLPDLAQLLAELRKYNGCFVLGLQTISQLDELYGQNISKTICGLTGTKLVFRTPDANTAKRMSEFLGEQEISEAQETISYGAHQMRDGVSLVAQSRRKPIVPYTDLMNLANLEAYIQFPRDLPLAKLKFEYV